MEEPTNTVLEVQDGQIDLSEIINHINKGLGIKPKEEEMKDGKVSG